MKVIVVLVSINCSNAKRVCDEIRGKVVDNIDKDADLNSLEWDDSDEWEEGDKKFITYDLKYFAEDFDDGSINQLDWFFTHILLDRKHD